MSRRSTLSPKLESVILKQRALILKTKGDPNVFA
jgi:hypothetical protein